MPYIIAYPKSFVIYKTKRKAETAAKDWIERQAELDRHAADVEIHRITFVTAFEPNTSEPKGDNGKPMLKTGVA